MGRVTAEVCLSSGVVLGILTTIAAIDPQALHSWAQAVAGAMLVISGTAITVYHEARAAGRLEARLDAAYQVRTAGSNQPQATTPPDGPDNTAVRPVRPADVDFPGLP